MKQVFRIGCISILLCLFTVIPCVAFSRKEVDGNWLNAFVKANPIGHRSTSSLLRGGTIQALRLDSVIVEVPEDLVDSGAIAIQSKMVFHYNEHGLLDESTQFMDNDNSGVYKPYERTVSTYDAYGHKMSDSIYESFDDDSALYLRTIKEYRYTPTGVMLMEHSQKRNHGMLEWIGDYGYEYQYDASGRVSVKKEYALINGNNWELVRKTDISYFSTNKPWTETRYYWNTSINDWTGMEKQDHYYDGNLRDSLVLFYSYYPLENRWALTNRELNRFDGIRNTWIKFNDQWDESTATWVKNSKVENAYDAQGYKTLEAKFGWDGEKQAWDLHDQEGWTFDQVGNLLSNTQYSNFEDNAWSLETIFDFRYNFQERAPNLDWLFGQDGIPCYNLLTGASLSWCFPEMDTSLLMANLTFHYSPKEIQGVTTHKVHASNLFYESSSRTLQIDPSLEATAVQVFDLQGRVLMDRAVIERLPMGNLSRGLYLVRLVTKHGIRLGKVMVE